MSMSAPFLNRLAKRPKNYHGRKSESRLGQSLAAQMNIASGALSQKGDFRTESQENEHPNFLHEAKATVKQSMSVKKEWLDKVTAQALHTGYKPILNISFTRENGEALPNGDWIMIRLADWKEFINAKTAEER